MDRRDFLLGSVSFGALVALPRCAPQDVEPEGPADGSYDRPFTRDDPGPWADKIEVHQPVLYGAMVDDKRVRLWLEVQDIKINPPKNHEMVQDHWIQELKIEDEFGNQIAYAAFPYEAQARLIVTVEIPERVQSLHAYAWCNSHGVWRATYDVAALKVTPAGDLRRPFTLAQPGQYVDIADKHVPILGKRPDGSFSIEVGDRAAGKLHEMTPQHYITQVVVYDQFDQLRALQNLGPNYAEPVVNGVNVAGANRVRVIAYCNLHFYWEAEFSVL